MAETKIRPLADKLLIKIIDDTQQSQGGIFIPDSAKEKPQKGEVIAAGPGALNKEGKREEMEVKVGDTVLFAKYAGTDVKFDRQELKILSEKDILAVIE
ncbi:MAG: co-chaperone GroES [Candidatus Gastranaerophilales bacterium]|nr:co-chaperone GroES [Candidatus Gastranaerophilales bacterium]